MPVIILVLLSSLIGSWIGSRLYRRKNRNPVTGAMTGGLAAFIPPFFIIYLIVVLLFMRKLQPGDKGYYTEQIIVGDRIATPQKLNNVETRLREIHSLHEQGLIDEDEYGVLKTQIIKEI